MKRRLVNLLAGLALLLCVAVWLASYAVALEWTFHPAPGRSYQTGVNFGAAFFATWPDPRRRPESRLLLYDARDRGVSLKGFGLYFSRSGRTPGGTGNVPYASVPLWLVAAAILAPVVVSRARARRWASRVAKGLCPSCAYALTGNVSGVCPECGTNVQRVNQ